MYLLKQKKQSFYNFDDKRSILSDRIDTLLFGKDKIEIMEEQDKINNGLNKIFPLNNSAQKLYN